MKQRPPGPDINKPLANPLLQQTERQIEGQLLPKMRAQYQKIVVAGMKVALENGTNGILYKLRESKDPVGDAAKGAVGLVLLMRKQSRGTMPLPAMVPAAMVLLLKALDFAQKAGLIPPVDEKTLVGATHTFTDVLFRAFHISPQMLQTAAKNVHGITQDPIRMRKVQEAAGFRKARPGLMLGAATAPQGGMIQQPQGQPPGQPGAGGPPQ